MGIGKWDLGQFTEKFAIIEVFIIPIGHIFFSVVRFFLEMYYQKIHEMVCNCNHNHLDSTLVNVRPIIVLDCSVIRRGCNITTL